MFVVVVAFVAAVMQINWSDSDWVFTLVLHVSKRSSWNWDVRNAAGQGSWVARHFARARINYERGNNGNFSSLDSPRSPHNDFFCTFKAYNAPTPKRLSMTDQLTAHRLRLFSAPFEIFC